MTIKGLFFICRPLNAVLAGFTVVIGAIAAAGTTLDNIVFLTLVKGYFTTLFLSASGYIINDIFDYEIDLINMPHRPLPSGEVTVKQAKILFIILFVLSQMIALMIDFFAFTLALFGGVLLILYAKILKRTGFLGNLTIATLVAIPFVFGGIVTKSYQTLIYPSGFAFLLTMGREIIKDIEDVEGDKIKDVKSLALWWGIKPARNVALLFLWLLAAIIVPIPIIIFHYYKTPVFIGLILVIVGIIAYSTYLLLNKTDQEIVDNCTIVKRLLKTSMTLGVIAFLSEGIIKLLGF